MRRLEIARSMGQGYLMEKDLERFVNEVTGIANSVDDIGKKAIRSTPEYKRLRAKYKNLDDLVAEIYKRADTVGVYKAWIEKEWAELRLRTVHSCRGAQHREHAFNLITKLTKEHPNFHTRMLLKYNHVGLINLAMRVICANPWSDAESVKDSDARQHIRRGDEFYEKLEESEKGSIENCKREAENPRPYGSGESGGYYPGRF